MPEVPVVHEPIGDALEDPQLGVGPLQPTVGHPVGVVEGEDLVSPFEQGLDDCLELREGLILIGLEEGPQGPIGPWSSGARWIP